MNLRDLEYICAVAEHRHFGKAARACHVSQPTLSGQIKKLEDMLGVTLFERSNKSVRVTRVGQDIVDLAHQARSAAHRIRSVALAAQDPLAGQLTLGLIPTIAPYLIPRFVGRMNHELPKLSVVYQEGVTEHLNNALLAGELDVAILATEPETDELVSRPLYDEPFHLITAPDNPLARYKKVKFKDIPEDELLLLTEGHCLRDQALALCSPDRRRRQQSLRATSLETLINLVASGQGMTLVPSMAMDGRWPDTNDLVSRPLKDASAMRRINLTFRRNFPRQELIHCLTKLILHALPTTVSHAKIQ